MFAILKNKVYEPLKRLFTGNKVRSWEVAQYNKHTMDWFIPKTDIIRDITRELESIRSKSRYAFKNYDLIKGFVNIVNDNTTGIYIKTDNELWNNFKDDIDGNGKSIADFQEEIITNYLVDGEVFIYFYYDDRFYLKTILPDLVDHKINDITATTKIVNGIEFNHNDVVLNYIVDDNRISKSNIIHLANKVQNSVRGIPWYASSLINLRHLHEYIEAVTVNARLSACNMGFIVNKTPMPAINTGENINLSFEPGMIVELPAGSEFQSYNPQFPSQLHDPFTKSIIRIIARGLGVSYLTLANDFSEANFASSRVALLGDLKFYKRFQKMLGNTLKKIYLEFCKIHFVSPGNYEIIYPKMEIDKYKDMGSEILALKNNLKSRKVIIEEMGYNYDEITNDILNDKLNNEGVNA